MPSAAPWEGHPRCRRCPPSALAAETTLQGGGGAVTISPGFVPTPDPRRAAPDGITLRIIASIQALLSLVWLAATPFLFNYGGAAAHPTVFHLVVLFWVSGLATAVCLFTARLWARLSALAWNTTACGLAVALLLRDPHPSLVERAWGVASALATAYLLVTSGVLLARAYQRSDDRARLRRRIRHGTMSAVVMLLAARLWYLATHTERALTAQLDARSEDARCTAARQLAARGGRASVALPQLLTLLRNTTCLQDGGDRLPQYVLAIGGAGPFIELVKNDSGPAAQRAVNVLRYGEHLNLNNPQLVATYVDGLHSRDEEVRALSAEALSWMSRAALPAAPDLMRGLSDPNDRVRQFAAEALGGMGALDGLRAALASPDSNVRLVARQWQDRIARGDTSWWHRPP